MHESSQAQPNGADAVRGGDIRSGGPSALHVPASGPSGELTVLERLEAFRSLIRHGNALLGEVVTYCRDAEAAVAQLAADKQDLDRVRTELQEAQARATSEAEAARVALAQVEMQRRELADMRTELMAARSEIEGVQRSQADNAVALEHSLRDSKQQQKRLEEELQRLRTQAEASRAIDARLGSFDHIEAKLRATEKELTETRKALDEERSRRDRAIALIKPRQLASQPQV